MTYDICIGNQMMINYHLRHSPRSRFFETHCIAILGCLMEWKRPIRPQITFCTKKFWPSFINGMHGQEKKKFEIFHYAHHASCVFSEPIILWCLLYRQRRKTTRSFNAFQPTSRMSCSSKNWNSQVAEVWMASHCAEWKHMKIWMNSGFSPQFKTWQSFAANFWDIEKIQTDTSSWMLNSAELCLSCKLRIDCHVNAREK